MLDPQQIARLRAALDVPWEQLLVELTITTGLRSGEIRGLVWDSIDLKSRRLFVEHQATRRGADDATKTESSLRTVPVPGYLIPELKRWKLACPPTAHGLAFAGEPDEQVTRTTARQSAACFPALAGLADATAGGRLLARSGDYL